MAKAGYSFTGSWSSAENIAWASLGSPSGLQDEVVLLHKNLMNSPGHKANILNGTFREIGIGFKTGGFEGLDAAFATQNFARSGSKIFLTGVAMDDRDGDRFYDMGEALGSLTVTAVSSTGAKYTTTTGSAGGYSLALKAGTYKVTFSGGGYSSVTKQVTVGTKNVKLDLVDPVKGTSGNNTIHGSSAADAIKGLAGNDKLYGKSGKDKLYGGSGSDTLSGGSDVDAFCFSGNWGADKIADFTNGSDRIDLRGNGLSFGKLSISKGNGDSDGVADDVIVKAAGQSIALLNVKTSLIGASDFLF
jgi:Ca2+-binding RTX toxin-like protein